MDPSEIKISAEPSQAHPETCKFTLDRPVYADGSVFFSTADQTAGSPLAEKLFNDADLDVADLMIADEVVTISLKGQGDVDWQIAGKKIADMIRQQLCSGEAAVSDKIKETLPSEGDIQKQVQQVLDTEINPAVAAHGGHVSLLDVKANRIYLEFGGGCQGCGMVDVTLKHGVEKAIREKIPAIGQILDTTDHASGKNPYYSPSKK